MTDNQNKKQSDAQSQKLDKDIQNKINSILQNKNADSSATTEKLTSFLNQPNQNKDSQKELENKTPAQTQDKQPPAAPSAPQTNTPSVPQEKTTSTPPAQTQDKQPPAAPSAPQTNTPSVPQEKTASTPPAQTQDKQPPAAPNTPQSNTPSVPSKKTNITQIQAPNKQQNTAASIPQSKTSQSEPQVAKRDSGGSNKKNKIVAIILLITGGLALFVATFFLLSFFTASPDKKADTNKEQIASEPKTEIKQRPKVDSEIAAYYPENLTKKTAATLKNAITEQYVSQPAQENDPIAISVNDKLITKDEYQEIIDYYKNFWEMEISSELETQIKNDFIERLILEIEAENMNLEFSEEELKSAAESKEVKLYPQYPQKDALIKKVATKKKIIQQKNTWVSGGSIVVQTGGPLVSEEAAKRNKDPEQLAMEVIKPYHDKAKAGESIIKIISEANNDPLINALSNNEPETHYHEQFTKDQIKNLIPWADPHYYEILFSLTKGTTSDIFTLKHPMDRRKDTWVDYGLAFIKVEKKNVGDADSYQEWLINKISQAEVKVKI